MIKIILILAFSLSSAFFILFLFSKQVFAACPITVDPVSVPEDYEGNVHLNGECFGINVEYKIIAYPRHKKLEDVNRPISTDPPVFLTPVIANKVKSNDGENLNGDLNFNDESSFGAYVYKPHDIGVWTILVCNSKTNTNDCDQEDNIVAQGEFSVQIPASTPTPTPQQDQPIVLLTDQDTCTFQKSYDYDSNKPESFIVIRVKNVNPSQTQYVWWTDWGIEKNASLVEIPQPTPSPVPIYKLEILKSIGVPPENKNPVHEDGHLYCIDIEGKARTGSNCIRLFFTSASPPEGNTACSEANSAEVSPSPKPHLPPCANWTLDGTPIPKDPTQEEYIRQNNLRDKIKCGAIHTGVGNISTNPQFFMSFIFSVVLGLAGGISLILIIISGYSIMASSGNPEALAAGRQRLISAIVGLLFIIFSFVILEVIGVDILRIPGFQP